MGGLFKPVMYFWLWIWSNITVPGIYFPLGNHKYEKMKAFCFLGEAIELSNVICNKIKTKKFCFIWILCFSFDFLLFVLCFQWVELRTLLSACFAWWWLLSCWHICILSSCWKLVFGFPWALAPKCIFKRWDRSNSSRRRWKIWGIQAILHWESKQF